MDIVNDSNLVVIGLVTTVLFVLIVLLVVQQLTIKKLSQPKYGFLGKQLPALAATLLLLGGLAGGVYLVNQDDTTFETEASLQVNVEIKYEEISRTVSATDGSRYRYRFEAIPSILNQVTGTQEAYGGNDGNKFDIYWDIESPTQKIAQAEINKSLNSPSSIEVTLMPGVYRVRALVQTSNVSQPSEVITVVVGR